MSEEPGVPPLDPTETIEIEEPGVPPLDPTETVETAQPEPEINYDPQELEKLRKRAERFGIPFNEQEVKF